ncbi:ParB/RepB/Spo0J family partition protein, partial [Listeria innocua]|nr:ParB/RepB/Spo0J family partition protein [Listeria innocua]
MNKDITFPVMDVRLVPITKIQANDYNPNRVASPEMNLLELSIIEDGFTQPLVCYYKEKEEKYILVDVLHRYRVAKERLNLKVVPVTVIDKPIEERMASTIRHNRARGTHEIRGMEIVIQRIVKKGWSDKRISKELGMDIEEVFRFKQVSGGMATVFLTNFIRCRTSFRMLFRLSLTMSLLGCDDLRQELTVKVRLP